MKRFRAWMAAVAIAATALTAAAQTSRQVIPFQGAVVVKPGMPPLDGAPYRAVRDFPVGHRRAKVFEDIQSVSIVNGAFAVEIGGGTTPLPSAVFAQNADLWLQVTLDLNRSSTFDQDEIIQPRTHLAAVPVAMYAERAGQAETANVAGETSLIRVPATLRDAGGNLAATVGANGAYIPAINLPSNADPARGGVYRNNVCIAWGIIDSDGNLVQGFGIRRASFDNADFTYGIELFNDVATASNTPLYSVQVTSLDNSLRPEVVVYETRNDRNIGVVIFGLDGALAFNDGSIEIPIVRSAFSIAVFGLLD